MGAFDLTAFAILHKAEIIEHLAQGGKLDDLHLGISRQAISKALKDDQDYQDAMIEYHASRLDTAEQAILDAADQVDVARARALHSAYSWRAEREQSRIWGAKQELTVNHNVSIIAALEEAQTRVIDGTCRDLTPGTPSADLCED